MFTWICPKCGSEVPPSENDCPTCRARAKAQATAPAVSVPLSPPPPPPLSSAPAAPQPPAFAESSGPRIVPAPAPVNPSPLQSQPVIVPPHVESFHASAPVRKAPGMSPALVALCSGVGVVVLLAILYTFVLPRGSSARSSSSVGLEKPSGGAAATGAAAAHPLAKYIEVTGVRVMEGGAGQAKISFVAVNHSPADLPELDAHLTLAGTSATVFEFPVTIPSIGPYESKDITTAVKTQMKPYELPDWQTLKPSLRIVSEK